MRDGACVRRWWSLLSYFISRVVGVGLDAETGHHVLNRRQLRLGERRKRETRVRQRLRSIATTHVLDELLRSQVKLDIILRGQLASLRY